MSRSNMPKPNEALKAYFSDNEKFADLFNAYAFGGEQVIRADELQDADTAYADTVEKVHGVEKIGKYRDIVRKTALGTTFAILGIENQEKIHYAMPIRMMLYDVLGYVAECKALGMTQESTEWTVDEFLSKLTKETKLTPIFTIVLYVGEKEWDGPKSLYDMLELDDRLKRYIPDYPLNLIDMGHCTLTNFKVKELEDLFYAMNYIYSKRAEKDNRIISNSTLSMAGILSGSRALYKQTKGGQSGMCEALEKLMQQGIEQGIEQVIMNSLKKGRTCEQIAEFNDIPLEQVKAVEKKLNQQQ